MILSKGKKPDYDEHTDPQIYHTRVGLLLPSERRIIPTLDRSASVDGSTNTWS
jgi:hypothetical protein